MRGEAVDRWDQGLAALPRGGNARKRQCKMKRFFDFARLRVDDHWILRSQQRVVSEAADNALGGEAGSKGDE